MRHAVFGRRLSRSTSHRLALRRNMCQSLIEHGEIRTTVVKAKEIRRMAERLVQMAVDGAKALRDGDRLRCLALRQRATAALNDRQIIPAEQREEYDKLSDAKREKVLRSRSGRRYRASTTKPGVKFTSESVINRLFTDIGPKMMRRTEQRGSGGYTRVIKLAERRLGDGGQLAILQLVGESDKARPQNTAKTERKRRAKVKYTAYAGKSTQRRKARRTKQTETQTATED